MIMFARIEVVRVDEEIVGEIDGLACFVRDEQVTWLLVESKGKNTSCGQGQLVDLFRNLFGINLESVHRVEIGDQISWYETFAHGVN